jgi:hypothetical protein
MLRLKPPLQISTVFNPDYILKSGFGVLNYKLSSFYFSWLTRFIHEKAERIE